MNDTTLPHRRVGETEHPIPFVQGAGPGSDWRSALHDTPELLYRLLLLYFVPGHVRKLTDRDVLADFGRRSYLLSFAAVSLAGFGSSLCYSLLGGGVYFNKIYLFAMPLLSLLAGISVLGCAQAVLALLPPRGLSARKVSYLKHLYAPYVLLPIAWVIFPMKKWFPVWEHHLFFGMLALALFLYVRTLRAASELFRRDELGYGLIVAGVPFFLAVFFLPQMSSFIVRTLHL